MSKIKNGGLDQYGAEPFEQQQFGTAGVEGVKDSYMTTAVCSCATKLSKHCGLFRPDCTKFHSLACTDVDECDINHGGCSPHAHCTNTEGSFNCTCRPGFQGDGINCRSMYQLNINCCLLLYCNSRRKTGFLGYAKGTRFPILDISHNLRWNSDMETSTTKCWNCLKCI